jgi:hypothetical protein
MYQAYDIIKVLQRLFACSARLAHEITGGGACLVVKPS